MRTPIKAVLAVAVLVSVSVASSVATTAQQADAPTCTQETVMIAGEGWHGTARRAGVTVTEMRQCNPWLNELGEGIFYPGDILRHPPRSITPTTTTTVPATTTTTTAPAPTTTIPDPVVTTSTTTTLPATTTTEPTDDQGADFVALFNDGDNDLARFNTGVFHRDWDRDGFQPNASQTWTGDHNLACDGPDTQRPLNKTDRDGVFYECRDHLMTSVGDVDGYSLAWFSPDQTFSSADTDTVSFDVNVTNLLARQWWEVILVDPASSELIAHPTVAGVAGDSGNGRPHLIPYPDGSVAVGNGPFAPGPVKINGENQGWQPICTSQFALDPEGCASKAIRRTWTITDNNNGTITVDFLNNSWTVAGSFPDQFKVVFKDHNYTPDKDGPPVGHTWHWDSIVIR